MAKATHDRRLSLQAMCGCVFALLIVLLCFVSDASARYCNSPSCAMCNRIFGPLPGYQLTSNMGSVRRSPRIVARAVAPKARTPAAVKPKPKADSIDSTPQLLVDTMLAIVHPTENDILYDLGCGDGRVCISAAVTYGCRSVGIEIDPKRAELARKKVKEAGVEDLVAIRTGDANDIGWVESATIVTMYLFPETMKQLMPRTENARVISSINHRLPGLTQTRFKTQESEIFIFRR